jgi:hypothetical protein
VQPTAIVTRPNAPAVAVLARARGWDPSTAIRVVEPAEGTSALQEAGRTPADLLLLDIACAAGPPVLRYRLARPDTRVVLLAPGRTPGDTAVAQVVMQAQVYDVVTDLETLGQVIDHPADLSAAARWLDASLAISGQPDATTRVVERIVPTPLSSHPVVIGLCGLVPGAGTTTTMAAIAGYLCRLGQPVLLAEALWPGRLPALTRVGSCMPPNVQCVADTPEAIAATAMRHQWPYILCDAGVVRLGGPDEDGTYADAHGNPHNPSAWPGWPLRPDRVVVVIPGAPWRGLPAAEEWIRTLPRDATPDALGVVWAVAGWKPSVDARFAQYEDALLHLLSGRYADEQMHLYRRHGGDLHAPVVVPLPDLHPHLAWPPGYAQPDPQLDGAVRALLDGLLPERNPRGRGR